MNELVFFNNHNINKDSLIGISCVFPIGNLPLKIYSHKALMIKILKDQLNSLGYENVKILNNEEDDWNNFNTIIVFHGLEYKGDDKFNFFGGISGDLVDNLIHLSNYNGKLISYGYDMPDFIKTINKRINDKSTSQKLHSIDLSIIDKKCKESNKIDFILKSKVYAFGDSHINSMYEHGDFVHRNDGLTLHGVLSRGIKNLLLYDDYEKLKIYFGNIDIRHHLMRQSDPKNAIIIMIEDYEKQLKDLNKKIELIEVLPIENESRKIPTTGFYKGTPFYGSWAERDELHTFLNKKLEEISIKNNWELYRFPENIKNEKGELSFESMEKPRSVHLNGNFYRCKF